VAKKEQQKGEIGRDSGAPKNGPGKRFAKKSRRRREEKKKRPRKGGKNKQFDLISFKSKTGKRQRRRPTKKRRQSPWEARVAHEGWYKVRSETRHRVGGISLKKVNRNHR